ncbi:MAG TPA: alanine--glyoxylate aminotransferase family protein [Anaerolineae bacterium]|nr:alanine--glyoxylate aminotransferase family protein [Anaerolineae bacterium]
MKNRTLLMIPGPIEFEPAVLAALGAPTTSHVAPDFIEEFGQALEKLRKVWLSDDGQPFVLAGSGTLAMDSAVANLIEPGDKALVINTGYFSDRMATIMERYGAQVTHVRAAVGGRPSLEEVEAALKQDRFKVMSITHVDTSTAVLTDVQALAKLAQHYGALSLVDGVCSIAGEEFRMSEWGVDVAFTASQKAVSVPPGLALLVAGPRAMAAFQARHTPVASYYSDWANWLPVMQAYEARRPAYFGTPAVNLVFALNVSLDQILKEGLDARFKRHRALGGAVQAAMQALELDQVPLSAEMAAHTLSAPKYPKGITQADLLPKVHKAGVTLAGGLHPANKTEYFRIGHMGPTNIGDVLATIGAIETALAQCGYAFTSGTGVAAAMTAYQQSIKSV